MEYRHISLSSQIYLIFFWTGYQVLFASLIGFLFTGNTLWRSIWSWICVHAEKKAAHSCINNLISKGDYSHRQRSMKVLLNLPVLLLSCAKLILPIILKMSNSNFSGIFLAWCGGMLNILYQAGLRRSSKLFNTL